MKKILFIIPAFNHGGTNKSLINMLAFLSNDEYNIDVFSMVNNGPYKKMLCNYNIQKGSVLLTSIYQKYKDIKKENLFVRFYKICIKVLYRFLIYIFGNVITEKVYDIVAKRFSFNEYYSVVAMQEGPSTYFSTHIKSTKKVAWIHCNYAEYQKLVNKNEIDIYKKYNNIICVSNYTKTIFNEHYPSIKNRCYSIHNLIDSEQIIKMANQQEHIDNRFNNKKFTILSIGRLSKVKQFDIIPRIAKQLIDERISFRWYIIGDGEEKSNLDSIINEYNVTYNVILLGQKDNPYPYIKQCDLFVCTSLSEACPNVINEAKVLHKIVITTNYGSACEMITNGINGYVVNKQDIKNTIISIIKNKKETNKILYNIKNYNYSNKEILNTVKKLL